MRSFWLPGSHVNPRRSHLRAGPCRARARPEPDSWWCCYAPAVRLCTQLRGARPRCDTTAQTRCGGRQGRAGAAGGVRPRRRGRRWLKKTFSVALAERRPALWVEVRRTEAAGRVGVEGEVGGCRARNRREASLTEGSGGREQPQRGAGRAAEGRGDLAPLATSGDGAATPAGTGAAPTRDLPSAWCAHGRLFSGVMPRKEVGF